MNLTKKLKPYSHSPKFNSQIHHLRLNTSCLTAGDVSASLPRGFVLFVALPVTIRVHPASDFSASGVLVVALCSSSLLSSPSEFISCSWRLYHSTSDVLFLASWLSLLSLSPSEFIVLVTSLPLCLWCSIHGFTFAVALTVSGLFVLVVSGLFVRFHAHAHCHSQVWFPLTVLQFSVVVSFVAVVVFFIYIFFNIPAERKGMGMREISFPRWGSGAGKWATIKMEICEIRQLGRESLHEYWERLKKLCASCPHY